MSRCQFTKVASMLRQWFWAILYGRGSLASQVAQWVRIGLQCRTRKRRGFIPWVGKIPWRKAWQPSPAFLPGESPWTEEPGRLQSIVAEPTETTEHTALTVRTKTTRWSRQKNSYFPHSTSRDVDDSYASLRKMALELLRWHELHGPSSVPRILHKSPLTNDMRYIHAFCMGPLFRSKFSSVFMVGKRLRETVVDQSQNKRGLLPCSCQI